MTYCDCTPLGGTKFDIMLGNQIIGWATFVATSTNPLSGVYVNDQGCIGRWTFDSQTCQGIFNITCNGVTDYGTLKCINGVWEWTSSVTGQSGTLVVAP